jgi:hypothetical protein
MAFCPLALPWAVTSNEKARPFQLKFCSKKNRALEEPGPGLFFIRITCR